MMKLLTFLVLFFAAIAAGDNPTFTPRDYILLDCGSSGQNKDHDGRTWNGDTESKYAPSGLNTAGSQASNQDSSVPQLPYLTARVFTSPLTYSFPLGAGRKFVRLYFYPSNYSNHATADGIFSVTAGPIPLLHNFSAYQTVAALNCSYLIPEFSVNVSSTGGTPLQYPIPDHWAMETFYQLNVGGQDFTSYEYTSMNSLTESKNGFWGVLAKKAKAFLEDEPVAQKFESYEREHPKMVDKESVRQEGLTIMESKAGYIIQETKKLHIRKRGGSQTEQNQALNKTSPKSFPHIQADYETQLKASRDVANAMAAKAKLLMREMKTVKADLAFAKERCTQLEEENKVLREVLEKGSNPEDDDLIRLQLETLSAEMGRLAHENSIYARENRREIVEYHQLTMQDIIYMDEGAEEVTEVCPIPPRSTLSTAPPRCSSPELASVVAPEDCPIVPMPPLPSPRPSNG